MRWKCCSYRSKLGRQERGRKFVTFVAASEFCTEKSAFPCGSPHWENNKGMDIP